MSEPLHISTESPSVIRAIAGHVISEESYVKQPDKHLFKVGDVCVLHGLLNFPEFNGQEVTITNIREDGSGGRAYYVKGEVNRFMNWVFEYRLRLKD